MSLKILQGRELLLSLLQEIKADTAHLTRKGLLHSPVWAPTNTVVNSNVFSSDFLVYEESEKTLRNHPQPQASLVTNRYTVPLLPLRLEKIFGLFLRTSSSFSSDSAFVCGNKKHIETFTLSIHRKSSKCRISLSHNEPFWNLPLVEKL